MRVLLIGAFPFPYPQGSQVFAAQQARALTRAGAEVALVSYGSGAGAPPSDIDWIPSSRAFAPRRMRSGPTLAKPFADAALVRTIVQAQRARSFDIALAHNAEAAFAAAAARRLTGLPFVYVAHTLFARELSSYAAPLWKRALDRTGAAIDELAARSADGVLFLTRSAERALAPSTRGPLACIAPGFEATPPPSEQQKSAACARHELEPGRFALYVGNLDDYQGLGLLAETVRLLEEPDEPGGRREPRKPSDPRIVIATHHVRRIDPKGALGRFAGSLVCVDDYDELRALSFSAAVLVAPRRIAGGFPIKLLNYMETGRPIVAYAHVAESLAAGSALLLDERAGAAQLAEALRSLVADPERSAALGSAARTILERTHAWSRAAAETLALAQRVQLANARRRT